MRLALISLVMIPLAVGCGKDEEEEIQCQELCEKRVKGETGPDSDWDLSNLIGDATDSDLKKCSFVTEAATCERCNKEINDLFNDEFDYGSDCGCYFYDDCGWPNFRPEDMERVLERFGGRAKLEEYCTQECDS